MKKSKKKRMYKDMSMPALKSGKDLSSPTRTYTPDASDGEKDRPEGTERSEDDPLVECDFTESRNGEGLRDLWNKFECFHENEESTRDAFLQFQTEFLRQYSDWNPEMTGFPGKGSPGHPSRVVQTVVLRYNRFVRKFETWLKTGDICDESLPDDMEVLSMIEIFSRTIHNRRILCDSRLFPFLKRHIVSFISKFDVLTSVEMDGISDDHPTLKWLERMATYIVSITANCSRHMTSSRGVPTIYCLPEMLRISYFSCLFDWATEIRRITSDLPVPLCVSEFMRSFIAHLQVMVDNILNVTSDEHVLRSAFKFLCENFGAPGRMKGIDSSEAKSEIVDYERDMQLMALKAMKNFIPFTEEMGPWLPKFLRKMAQTIKWLQSYSTCDEKSLWDEIGQFNCLQDVGKYAEIIKTKSTASWITSFETDKNIPSPVVNMDRRDGFQLAIITEVGSLLLTRPLTSALYDTDGESRASFDEFVEEILFSESLEKCLEVRLNIMTLVKTLFDSFSADELSQGGADIIRCLFSSKFFDSSSCCKAHCASFQSLIVSFVCHYATSSSHSAREYVWDALLKEFSLLDMSPEKLLAVTYCFVKIMESRRGEFVDWVVERKSFNMLFQVVAKLHRFQDDSRFEESQGIVKDLKAIAQLLVIAMLEFTDIKNAVIADSTAIGVLFDSMFDSTLRHFTGDIVATLITTSSPSRIALLVSSFMELFASAQSAFSVENLGLVLHLLRIIQVVLRSPQQLLIQKEFTIVHASTKLLNVFHTPHDIIENAGCTPLQIAKSVMEAIGLLMAANKRTQREFQKDVGYEQLEEIVLCFFLNKIPLEFYDAAFEILTEGSDDRVKNEHIIPTIIHLCRHSDTDDVLKVISRMRNVVSTSTANRQKCSGVSTIDHLLELMNHFGGSKGLLEEIVLFVRDLGVHSISVKELNLFFNAMRDLSIEVRGSLLHTFFQSMEDMTKKDGPEAFFDFEGASSGISLPTVERFPGPKGFSFCTWLRIESFEDVLQKPKYEPQLYCLLSQSGSGMEALFVQGFLIVRNFSNGVKVSEHVFHHVFEEKTWYFLCLVHSHGKGIMGKSEIKLYVNGKLQERSLLKFPKLPKSLDVCCFGTNKALDVLRLYRESPFRGEMGTIYLFDDAIGQSYVEGMYALGPNITSTFQTSEVLSVDDQLAHLFDGQLGGKLFLSYNAKACEGWNLIRDTSRRRLDARLLMGSEWTVTHNIKDVIGCIGGVKILFPFLLHIARPTEHVEVDSALSWRLISVLVAMMRNHQDNKDDMLRCRGFGIVNFLLKRISSVHLTKETIQKLQDAVDVVIDSPELFEEAVLKLFFDLRLWMFAAYDVQVRVIELCREFAMKYTFIQKRVGVQGFLDRLRMCYWLVPSKESLGKSEVQEGKKKRPEKFEILSLRVKIIEILKSVCNVPRRDELRCFLMFFSSCRDSDQIRDVLKMFMEFLFTEEASIFEDMVELHGELTLLNLMSVDDREIRMLALRCYCRLVEMYPRARIKFHLDSPSSFASMLTILKRFEFDEEAYGILLDFMLRESRLESVEVKCEEKDHKIKVAGVFAVIFTLLLKTTPSLRVKAVQDMFDLLSHGQAEDFGKLLNIMDWQNYIFDVLHVQRSEASHEEYVALEGAMCDLVNLLHVFAATYAKSGWTTFEHTMGYVYWFSKRGDVDHVPLIRKMFVNIFNSFRSDIDNGKLRSFGSIQKLPLLNNFVHLVTMAEDFMFHSTRESPLSKGKKVHLDDEGESSVKSVGSDGDDVADGVEDVVDDGSGDGQPNANGEAGNGEKKGQRGVIISQDEVQDTRDKGSSDADSSKRENVSSKGKVEEHEALEVSPAYIVKEGHINASSEDDLHSPTSEHSPQSPFSPTPSVARHDPFASPSSGKKSEEHPSTVILGYSDELLHRDQNGVWEDTGIADAVLYALQAWDLLSVVEFDAFQPLRRVEAADHLHDGGCLRIAIGMIRHMLRENPRKCAENAERLERILKQDEDAEKERLRFSELWTVTGDLDESDEFHSRLLHVAYVALDILWYYQSKKHMDNVILMGKIVQNIFRRRADVMQVPLRKLYANNPNLATVALDQFLMIVTNRKVKRYLCHVLDKIASPSIIVKHELLVKMAHNRKIQCAKTAGDILEYTREDMYNKENAQLVELMKLCAEYFEEETERLVRVNLDIDEDERTVVLNWIRIRREVTDERGAWGTSDAATKRVVWKLDRTTDRLLTRRRLIVDHDGTRHEDASALRDIRENRVQSHEVDLDLLSKVQTSQDTYEDILRVEEEEAALLEEPAEEVVLVDENEIIYSTTCQLVKGMEKHEGTLEITAMDMIFRPKHDLDGEMSAQAPTTTVQTMMWSTNSIENVRLRRYRLVRSALEFHFDTRKSAFFNFPMKDRSKVVRKILSVRPKNLKATFGMTPEAELKKSGLTELWRKRAISNFEYLMRLNDLAGRTYHDLSQYFVFPWVIADYVSDRLNLQDDKVYRDLSKPIGALNDDRREQVVEKYEGMVGDPDMRPFHYGSHYSSAGVVLYFLLRLEPYTSYHIMLQSGKFDHADRLFHSMGSTWNNVCTSSADVKELVPEFYYLPDFLRNVNDLDMGVKQNKEILGDVVLPPWASTPEEFVRINREALESDYVSEHLHEWIDLIFGYKQRGREAVDAVNVFHYLTYEGTVDLDKITDPLLRQSMEAQIENFGQTPSQLFFRPHAKRARLDPMLSRPLLSSPELLREYDPITIDNDAIIAIQLLSDKLFLSLSRRVVSVQKFAVNTSGSGSPFSISKDSSLSGKRALGVPFPQEFTPTTACFRVAFFEGRDVVFTCGHWDMSFKSSTASNSALIQSIWQHRDIVTCLALGADGQTLVTGSKDTTVIVWNIVRSASSKYLVHKKARHVLFGHDDEVTDVAVNTDLDMVVSASKDGSCIIHSLVRGRYVRSIYHSKRSPIDFVGITQEGHILIVSQTDNDLQTFSLNGVQIASRSVRSSVQSFAITKDGRFVVVGLRDGAIEILDFRTLATVHRIGHIESYATSLEVTPDQRYIFAGMKSGVLRVFAFEHVRG